MNRNRWKFRVIVSAMVFGLLLSACRPAPTSSPIPMPTATSLPSELPTPTSVPPAEDVIYLAIVWHQHQPLYRRDPETGLYAEPWVRLHATRDYYDMAAMAGQYPDVRVTFSLSPLLVEQLEDLAGGVKDRYWTLAEKPADQLTEDDKQFVVDHFFDLNPEVIARFPRYQELWEEKAISSSDPPVVGGSTSLNLSNPHQAYDAQAYRDLQVLFNLAWFDPDLLAREPLKSLVEKGEGFTEEDKQIVLEETRDVLAHVLPLHAELQRAGQIEVATTAYGHPILPLLHDTDLTQEAMPDATLPERFAYPQDAGAQVERGVVRYREVFGQEPRGMWPAGGAVAQEIVKAASDAGVLWIASGEQVLARSLGLNGFSRDGRGMVQQADDLYRPYYVRYRDERPVAILFGDQAISDRIARAYSNVPGEEAATDVIERLYAIKARLDALDAAGPHLVSVILDGESAWEEYEDDGKAFLHELYRLLSEDKAIRTVTPSEYLEMFPRQREIEDLWPGSWFSPDFAAWIGEEEENLAWEYLRRTRGMLDEVLRGEDESAAGLSSEQRSAALDAMYAAEGSDWFWWYGADYDSGHDQTFDRMYRQRLEDVYRSVDETPPPWLDVPIILARSPSPAQEAQGFITPTMDGVAQEGEWADAGLYQESGAAIAQGEDVIQALYYGHDQRNLYLRLDSVRPWTELGRGTEIFVYLGVPGAPQANGLSHYGAMMEPPTTLGFGATHEVRVNVDPEIVALAEAVRGGGWGQPQLLEQRALSGTTLELAVPFDALQGLTSGDRLTFVAVVSREARDLDMAPLGGPARVVVP